MKLNRLDLLSELTVMVTAHLEYVKSLKDIPQDKLNQRLTSASWSTLECLEHLNLYGTFYIPEITKRLRQAKPSTSSEFNSGYWGNKFALDMLPKENMKIMKTFKSKNPIHSDLEKENVIGTFIQQQYEFTQLLEQAKNKDLTNTKTAITLPLLKFRLGDTFRFVIYHNERHIVQAKRVLTNNL